MAISDVIKKYFEPQEQVRLRDVLNPSNLASGVSKTSKGIVGGVQQMGQSAFRAYAGLGGAITGKTLTPSTYFQKQLYGTDKPITLRSVGSELGLSEKSKFAAPVGFALGVADLVPGGNVSKQGAVNLLKNANKADDALKVLTKVMGVADDVARKYVDDAVRLTDAKQLSSLVDNVVNESQQVSRFVQKGKSALGIGKADPLTLEARKYKSAEEFVKAQGKEIYHSTDSEAFSVFDPTKAAKGETYFNPLGDGLFLSKDKAFTQRFGKNTFEYVLPKNAKTKVITDQKFQVSEYPAAVKGTLKKLGIKYDDLDLGDKVMINRLVENNPPIQALNEVEFLIKEDIAPKFGVKPKPNQVKDIMQGIMTKRNAKYDAVIYRSTDDLYGTADEIIIPKDKVPNLKNKSQLTDIWERANKVTDNLRTRGFVTSAKEILPDSKIAGQYVPRATDALAIKAKNLIKTDFAQAERIALTGSDDNAVAIASELLKKYADDITKTASASTRAALNDKAAQIANTIAPKLTEQGRAIQAASILGRLTPEGQVRFAAREIQRYNETAKIKIPELTGEQTGEILKEMREINNMANGADKAIRFKKLQDYIQDLVPTPIMNKIITVWKAGLLTGIKTQGLNMFSNLFHGFQRWQKIFPLLLWIVLPLYSQDKGLKLSQQKD